MANWSSETFASSSNASILSCCSPSAATASADLAFLATLARLWEKVFFVMKDYKDEVHLGLEDFLPEARSDPGSVHLSVATSTTPTSATMFSSSPVTCRIITWYAHCRLFHNMYNCTRYALCLTMSRTKRKPSWAQWVWNKGGRIFSLLLVSLSEQKKNNCPIMFVIYSAHFNF